VSPRRSFRGALTVRSLLLALRIVLPIVLLAFLARRLGSGAFRPALDVVSALPLLAALVLGGVAVMAQSARWRVVMNGVGLPLRRRDALTECYRAGALNTVLPGGVAGDVLRAWRQRTGVPRGWRPGAGAVLAERSAGLCVLLLSAAGVLVFQSQRLIALALAALAFAAWLVGRPALRRLGMRQQVAVWVWSVIALAALVGLAVVAANAVGVEAGSGATLVLTLALLAGMAVPLSLGGWGPREGAGAVAAMLIGIPAAEGVAVAAGYGLLAMVSVLPGFVALGNLPQAGAARRRLDEVELDTDVVTEREAA
jgi:uncharacterized membrane protein YbhN (UPF0104 family)